MCAISGVLYKGKKNDIGKFKSAVEAMNQAQIRRGPDDHGIVSIRVNQRPNQRQSAIILGNRRLSILDLSEAGHQPMSYKIRNPKSEIRNENALWITFNGEIYNFRELKKDLEKKGYKFQTKTDTEVILALYAEYGEDSFSMLCGMFAFGIYDVGRRKLFLVKDRYGIKPLYYYVDNEKIVFASTVGAIKASRLAPDIRNHQAFIGLLLFGSVPLPMTTIKNVFAVPAGHYLIWEMDEKQKLVKYYEPLEFFQNNPTTNNLITNTRSLLEDAVNSHLISDAPLGVFLSGGMDSSAIAALAACNMGKSDFPNIDVNFRKSDFQKLITLSVVFDEKEFSEEYYSDLVAKKIDSDHRKIKITKQDFFSSMDEIFDAMDQPTIDGVNTFFIAQAAKKAGLKAVLSGLGGDEIFLGYPHFRRAALFRKIQNLPRFLKLPLNLPSLLGGRYSKLSYFLSDDILSFYLGFRGLFTPEETAKILDINLSEVNNFLNEILVTQLPNYQITKLHPVDLMSYLELKFYLQNQLLKDTDFMSMYHSVEVRVPFLDHKLVEYISSLPPEVKLGNFSRSFASNFALFRDHRGINKPLLTSAVSDILPKEIYTRSKMGFTFPFQKWLMSGEYNLKTCKLKNLKTDKSHWSRYWAIAVLQNSKF